MHPFTLHHPTDQASALAAATAARTRFIAGGTNLVDLMKMNVEQPEHLVNINRLPLSGISELPGGGLRIGALVKNSDLAWHPVVRKKYTVLSEALLSGASPQLRNMATVGGNLMQRTRCPYFFDVHAPCNKRQPGSGCSAIRGYNRMHAILGGSAHCIAAHPSDMCVALSALNASVQIEGADGARSVSVRDFHLLPGDTPQLETVLRPGELITAVDLPPMAETVRSHYLKVRDRSSYAFALVSAAVLSGYSGNRGRQASVALGGVGTKPWYSTEASAFLQAAPEGKGFEEAATLALKGAVPYKYNGFKPELARRTLIQALQTVHA